MTFVKRTISLILLTLAAVARSGAAQTVNPTNVTVIEHPNAQIPLDLALTDEHGKEVTLRDYFQAGRPVVLQMGYLGCPMLCNVMSQDLVTSAAKADLKAGKEFEFLFVSIDPTEAHSLAALKRQAYLEEYGRPEEAEGFHFFTGHEDSAKQLANAVGFVYQKMPDGQYAHDAVLFILTPDGHISRYLYGMDYPPQTLRLSLVEASHGEIGTTVDQFLLLCLHFDPKVGSYAWKGLVLMRFSAGATVIALGGTMFWLFRREKHVLKPRTQSDTTE